VVVIDTHVWVWWVQGDKRLRPSQLGHLTAHEPTGLGVSVMSCWEVARLAADGKITLPVPIDDWVRDALAYPGVRILDMTPAIVIESTRLPDPFHKDPADRILVATARCPASRS
jgi:PIN domain nuclease of toxin-antitoxin system